VGSGIDVCVCALYASAKQRDIWAREGTGDMLSIYGPVQIASPDRAFFFPSLSLRITIRPYAEAPAGQDRATHRRNATNRESHNTTISHASYTPFLRNKSEIY